ncbi:MAG: glycosyltransferase family 4 protein, partial [Myxococcales bacterium]|nr:glycosyltransferase family 4 protein [Myxococcales bacterium]
AVNWLDSENPDAGGAEIHFFEIFSRLAAAGDSVTLVASGWSGCSRHTVIDGIDVYRYGGRHSFAVRGRGAVRRHLQEPSYDVVVEDINKLPLYVSTLTQLPVYVIVPHLFGTTAFREASWPVASIVWLAERSIPRVYRHAAFHAISESTQQDLASRGIPERQIRVIHPGVDLDAFRPDVDGKRAPDPTFLYVGRLKRYKRIDVAIRGLAELRATVPGARLQIAGTGSDRPRLERLVRRLGLTDAVQFLGFVSEQHKLALFRAAWSLIFPSFKEGWGMTNIEGAACGTPTIAADSPGLRESVVHERTGLLVRNADKPHAWAHAMDQMSRDHNLRERFGVEARVFSETLTWERAAQETRAHLMGVVADRREDR